MLSLKNLSDPFSKLIIVYLFWVASWIIAGSLFEVYFFSLGLSIQEIVATSFFWYIGSLILLPLFKKIDSKKFMLFGIVIALISVIALYYIRVKEMGFAYRFLLSLTHFFFWVPFNIAFYEFRKNNNAQLGALYYSIGPLLTIILPALSGLIAANVGYGSLYLLAAVFYAITLILALLFLENKKYEYDLVKSIKSIAGLRSLIFLEGFSANMVVSVTLETMLLIYTNKPLEFGTFISLATAFSILATFLTAKISDTKKRRRELVIVSVIAFGLSVIFASGAKDITLFFFGFALISFFKTVFFPLPLALVVDNSNDLVGTMIGREFMLNVGRVVGSIVGFILLFNYSISFVLFINGVSLLLYPIFFELKKRKLSKI